MLLYQKCRHVLRNYVTANMHTSPTEVQLCSFYFKKFLNNKIELMFRFYLFLTVNTHKYYFYFCTSASDVYTRHVSTNVNI
jgi:hypothetical protein